MYAIRSYYEFARMLPHFVLMGLGAIVWYNQDMGDSPIVTYLLSMVLPRDLLMRRPSVPGKRANS